MAILIQSMKQRKKGSGTGTISPKKKAKAKKYPYQSGATEKRRGNSAYRREGEEQKEALPSSTQQDVVI